MEEQGKPQNHQVEPTEVKPVSSSALFTGRPSMRIGPMSGCSTSTTMRRARTCGSSSACALEFTRGAEHIYALWTVRAQCAMEMEFPADTPLTNVGFYGAQTKKKTSVTTMPPSEPYTTLYSPKFFR